MKCLNLYPLSLQMSIIALPSFILMIFLSNVNTTKGKYKFIYLTSFVQLTLVLSLVVHLNVEYNIPGLDLM